jgi:hypothetical protein
MGQRSHRVVGVESMVDNRSGVAYTGAIESDIDPSELKSFHGLRAIPTLSAALTM